MQFNVFPHLFCQCTGNFLLRDCNPGASAGERRTIAKQILILQWGAKWKHKRIKPRWREVSRYATILRDSSFPRPFCHKHAPLSCTEMDFSHLPTSSHLVFSTLTYFFSPQSLILTNFIAMERLKWVHNKTPVCLPLGLTSYERVATLALSLCAYTHLLNYGSDWGA